jgi:hypothetical protein
MDAYDTQGVTEQFKYTGSIADLEHRAAQYRESVNAVSLTDSEIAYFNQLKAQFLK